MRAFVRKVSDGPGAEEKLEIIPQRRRRLRIRGDKDELQWLLFSVVTLVNCRRHKRQQRSCHTMKRERLVCAEQSYL